MMVSEVKSEERIAVLKQLINTNPRMSSLTSQELRSLHLDQLSHASTEGRLTVFNSGSAVGEAVLLSGITGEVQRRRSKDRAFWRTLLGNSTCRKWVMHREKTHEYEQKMLRMAPRSLPDSD